MAKRIPEEELRAIEEAARLNPSGVTAQQISRERHVVIPLRTLQYRLKYTDHKRFVKEGEGRWAKYRIPAAGEGSQAVAVRCRPRSK